jgi:hypothetical protein
MSHGHCLESICNGCATDNFSRFCTSEWSFDYSFLFIRGSISESWEFRSDLRFHHHQCVSALFAQSTTHTSNNTLAPRDMKEKRKGKTSNHSPVSILGALLCCALPFLGKSRLKCICLFFQHFSHRWCIHRWSPVLSSHQVPHKSAPRRQRGALEWLLFIISLPSSDRVFSTDLIFTSAQPFCSYWFFSAYLYLNRFVVTKVTMQRK